MNVFIACILILSITVLLLSIAILLVIKKTIYLSRKEKDFIEFAIDMYIDYAKDLDINSETEHDRIVVELKKIKDKLNKE